MLCLRKLKQGARMRLLRQQRLGTSARASWRALQASDAVPVR
jgi:hypothetical protein